MDGRQVGRLLVTFTAVALVAVACGGGDGATDESEVQERALQLGLSVPADSPPGLSAEKFKEIVEEESEGKITIEIFPAGQLGGERDMVENLQLHSLDMTVVAGGVLPGFVEEFSAIDIPYVFSDEEHVYEVLDGQIGQDLFDLLEPIGIKGLGWGEFGWRHMMNGVRPIVTPSDMDGLTMRSIESPVYVEMYELLGATPVPIPGPEIYSALEQGVVDGIDVPIFAARALQFFETPVKYISLTKHTYSSNVLLMDGAVWDSFSPREREIFDTASSVYTTRNRELNQEAEDADLTFLVEQGLETNDVDIAPFQEAMQPMYEDLGAGVVDIVERILDAS